MIKKGFTLIELMVVMGIMAVLAAGVVALLNPVDKINSANDATVQSGVGEAATAAQAFAARNGGKFPSSMTILTDYGELSTAPAGVTITGTTCSGTPSVCDSVAITGALVSQKYKKPGTQVWRYTSSDNKTCAVAAINSPACQ